MKLSRYLPALFFIVMPWVASDVLASGAKTVVVTNSTSYTVNEFYASPNDAGGWDTETNLIAGQPIAPGQAVTVTIADDGGGCTYDLMAVLYGVAQYAYEYQINACAGGAWNITISP